MARRLDRRRFVIGGASATAGALLATRNGRGLAAAQDATPIASPMASPGASPVASPTVNTEVSGQLRYLVSASAQEEIRAIQTILSTTFRERYPNLEVQVEPAASGGSGDPLLTSMVAGEAPDFCEIGPGGIEPPGGERLFGPCKQAVDVHRAHRRTMPLRPLPV